MEGAGQDQFKAQLEATDEQLKIPQSEVARQEVEMQRLKELLLEKETLLTEQKAGNARELSLAQTQAKRDVGNFQGNWDCRSATLPIYIQRLQALGRMPAAGIDKPKWEHFLVQAWLASGGKGIENADIRSMVAEWSDSSLPVTWSELKAKLGECCGDTEHDDQILREVQVYRPVGKNVSVVKADADRFIAHLACAYVKGSNMATDAARDLAALALRKPFSFGSRLTS
jgi:hypothetical protein